MSNSVGSLMWPSMSSYPNLPLVLPRSKLVFLLNSHSHCYFYSSSSYFELQAVWPDLEKIRHFVEKCKIIKNPYLMLGKIFNLLWQTLWALRQTFQWCKWPIIEKTDY